jgi:hypothetical protein
MRKTIFLILQMVVPPLPRPLVPLVPLVPKLCLGTQVAKLCLASGTGPGREAEFRALRTQAELGHEEPGGKVKDGLSHPSSFRRGI